MRRPTSATVFGILFIIFGGLGILGGLCGTLTQLGSLAGDEPAYQVNAVQLGSAARTYSLVSSLVGLCVSIAYLVAGCGLLGPKEWARKLAIATAIYGLIATPITSFLSYKYVVRPTMDQMPGLMEQAAGRPLPPSDQGMIFGMMGQMMVVGLAIGVLIAVIWSALVLAFMCRPIMRDACAGRWQPPAPQWPQRENPAAWASQQQWAIPMPPPNPPPPPQPPQS